MKIGQIFKKKVFISWALSYAFVAILPILIGSIVYIEAVKTVKDEVNKVNSMSLQQLRSVLDGKFEELSRTLSNIALSQDVQTLMYNEDPLTPKEILTIREVQKDLTKFKLSNGYIDEIYIYVNNNDFIFSSSYKFNSDDIASICGREFLLGYDELYDIFNKKNFKTIRLLGESGGNSQGPSKVLLIHSLYLNNLNSPSGTIMISFDTSKLSSLLVNLELTSQGEVILVNNMNEFYSTRAHDGLEELFYYDKLREGNDTFYENVEGKNTAVTHMASDELDLQYISLVPTYIFLNKVQYIKNIIFIYIAVCLLTGMLAAFYLAKRNYSPVEKLKQMFINRLGESESENEKENEFMFLENSLKTLLDENRSISASLKQQKFAQVNNLFIKLLKGRFSNQQKIKASLEVFDIKLKSDCFMVAVFSIESLNRDLFGEVINNEDGINLIFFIVKNIVEELLSENNDVFLSEIDGMIACILNINESVYPAGSQEFRKDIAESLNKAMAFVENKFEISLAAAISDIHYGITEIAKAYSEVLEVFEYKTLVGENEPIINYDSIHSDTICDINDSYNLEKERQIANCIKAGDYKDAKEILDNLMTKNFKKDFHSIQLAKCRVFGLINTTLNAIGEIRTEFDVEFFEKLDPVNKLINTKSIAELKTQVDGIFDSIIEYTADKDKKRLPDWIFEVERYINQHYHETDISIAGISDQLGMSVSYLSRTFKKYKGVGLLDYIHKLRIQKAKDLLNADMSLNDIAAKIGYLESKSLIRSFKRYEGVTPGKFRETLNG